MKKIIFSLMLCLMLCSQTFAQEVQTGIAFVAWYKGEPAAGCKGMVDYAVSAGRTILGDNSYQIPFTDQGNGTYILSMPNGVTFSDGDVFIFRDNTVGDVPRWVKAQEGYNIISSGETTFTHVADTKDLLIECKDEQNQPSSFTAYAIELSKPTADTYTITFRTTRIASVSPYWLDVWDLSENQKWDTAGGLYEPMKHANGTHELDEIYYADLVETDATTQYMAFYGPLEGEQYIHHINGSELYVIDFTSNGHTDGLLIKAPTKSDMDAATYNPDANTQVGTPLHLRSGIRFGVLNTNYATGTPINDPLRYLKWGHCFRLNEESRALNAFVTAYNPEAEAGRYQFKDIAGPCLWNGNNPNSTGNSLCPAGEASVNYALGVPGEGYEKYNKYGDNRLLAEHDIYLQKMYLEVIKRTVNGKVFEDFYLRFEGTYNLEGAAGSVPHNHFVEASLDNAYSTTPNIFIGSDIYLDNRAFHRFYNLNVDEATIKDELGFESVADYNTLMDGWYKGLSFSDTYTVVSNYKITDENGNDVIVIPQQMFQARDGKYYAKAENSEEYTEEVSTYSSLNYDRGTTTLVQGYDRAIVFNPEAENAPKNISVETTYNFANAYIVPKYTTTGVINTNYELGDGIDVKAEASSMNDAYNVFTSNVTWGTELPTHTFRRINADRKTEEVTLKYPVTTWALQHGECTTGSCTNPTLAKVAYDAASGTMSLTDAYQTADALEQNETRYVHYDVAATYTFGYVDGIHDASELDAVAATEDDEVAVVSPYAQPFESEDATYTFGTVTYTLKQQTIDGENHAEFIRSTSTDIDGVSAAENVPAEYYNLQGIKVANPEAGQIYIVRRGATTTKEIF